MLTQHTPAQPNEPAPPRKPATGVVIGIALVYVVIIVLFGVSISIYHPLRIYEATLLIGVITSPIWVLIADYFKTRLLALQLGINTTKLSLGCFLCGILLTYSIAYFMNGKFDDTPEQ